MNRILLASTSPRRKQILKDIGLSFDVVSPDYNEDISNKIFSYDLVEKTAENKANSVGANYSDYQIIISADTVVVLEDKILGKPKDYKEAYKMLFALNGREHIVVTSVCVINRENNKKLVQSATSKVKFNHMSKIDLANYISKFKPFDKAGSYGIQELPAKFVSEIEGEYNNIVGLPDKLLSEMLDKITK